MKEGGVFTFTWRGKREGTLSITGRGKKINRKGQSSDYAAEDGKSRHAYRKKKKGRGRTPP